MWHIICFCLPAVTRSEQQRFFTLFREVLRAYGREPGEMDIGLFFLHTLSAEEVLTVLEERLDMVVRSQEYLALSPAYGEEADVKRMIIDDHMRTLLEAERDWLKRTIARIRSLNIDGKSKLDMTYVASQT
ncbi:hypothetical protein EPA93_07625 [Ktedonosporobacter rubrisoli]|uniref:Uncharacterized protein n=1 Tax=Ktedonosporobacter rubrisoli TaxID=2509675 RepID=A0A4P6JL34_KTERU|nr:hypothetical protein [Ktedonosporobacter rubrisoli]QBD75884.1 hypothetical protein EPA93_07625 [Ktedonosporobacter rubrisoli]